mgnify:FL=1
MIEKIRMTPETIKEQAELLGINVVSNCKRDETLELLEEINELMESMGFELTKDRGGKYWHMFFGRDIEFDLSASGKDTHSIMAHVFRVAIEYGKADKIYDIKKVLGM